MLLLLLLILLLLLLLPLLRFFVTTLNFAWDAMLHKTGKKLD